MKKSPKKKLPAKRIRAKAIPAKQETLRYANRDERIRMEIIADAYSAEDVAMGWFCYLEEKLQFPFLAKCIAERAISPLRKGEELEIVGMAPEDECAHEMFVVTRWDRRNLAIPLAQIKPDHDVDAATTEAVDDWHCWIKQGHAL